MRAAVGAASTEAETRAGGDADGWAAPSMNLGLSSSDLGLSSRDLGLSSSDLGTSSCDLGLESRLPGALPGWVGVRVRVAVWG